jgi:integrase
VASLYKRGKNYWISYYLETKQVRKSLNTTDARVARGKLKKLEYELALGDLHAASRLPLAPILESFCHELKATRTRKSYKNDFSRLRIFFGPRCDALKPGLPGVMQGATAKHGPDRYAGKHAPGEFLEDITPQTINRFISARIRRDDWSAKTANLLRQTLHKLFSYAIKHHNFRSLDRRYPNPAVAVERRRESAPEIRFLKMNEIDQQLEVVEKRPVIHTMVATYIYAGLRREEGVWLTLEDVDLTSRLIRIQAKTVGEEFWQAKTRRNRVIPISDALFAILSTYQNASDSTWFFPSPTGKRWDPDNFSADLRDINNANGLDWSCLDFRHTFGSHLAQKGESLYKIATLLGNSPDICRRHYAALIPEKMSDVVEFTSNEQKKTNDGETQEMLQEILRKLGGAADTETSVPYLRLVKPTDLA